MTAPEADVRRLVHALQGAPGEIVRITQDHTDSALRMRPGPDAWSAHEILAHLRACADVWGDWVHRMLAENHARIRYFSPRSVMTKEEYTKPPFREVLGIFAQERAELVRSLEVLGPADWSREGIFTAKTAPKRIPTVYGTVFAMENHESRHLEQLRRTVG
ncbi:MAG: DinB family protein [Candidatus Eisenbacteria bacterium]|uniref:DinB family protein n=1 Tax=Eiseniibacteriota bacterium TaxID=2212470 RepID=A0A956M3J0_UNCEI|nr:DinB family protein [Candidatus Eisenbacteria bacterium]